MYDVSEHLPKDLQIALATLFELNMNIVSKVMKNWVRLGIGLYPFNFYFFQNEQK